MDLDLDNRLYILRNSNLPEDLRSKFIEADKLFLREQEKESEVNVNKIELECKMRGIVLNSNLYPQTLFTQEYGSFSFFLLLDNHDAKYSGDELVTEGLTINASEYDGILITQVPEIFREDPEDDMIRYFTLEGYEV